MQLEDFYELRIDQKIWYKGEERIINGLSLPTGSRREVSFKAIITWKAWYDICKDCSTEPPKKARKFTVYRHWWLDMDTNKNKLFHSPWTVDGFFTYINNVDDIKGSTLIKTETKIIEEDI